MKILGLETCADTVVGNEMLRGISGGQKKRVTTGKATMNMKLSYHCSTIIFFVNMRASVSMLVLVSTQRMNFLAV